MIPLRSPGSSVLVALLLASLALPTARAVTIDTLG